jgi:hypothetical protein
VDGTVDGFQIFFFRFRKNLFLCKQPTIEIMQYIDSLIPLFGGLYILAFGDKLVKPMDPDQQKKKRLLKRSAYALIFVSIGYLAVKLFS